MKRKTIITFLILSLGCGKSEVSMPEKKTVTAHQLAGVWEFTPSKDLERLIDKDYRSGCCMKVEEANRKAIVHLLDGTRIELTVSYLDAKRISLRAGSHSHAIAEIREENGLSPGELWLYMIIDRQGRDPSEYDAIKTGKVTLEQCLAELRKSAAIDEVERQHPSGPP